MILQVTDFSHWRLCCWTSPTAWHSSSGVPPLCGCNVVFGSGEATNGEATRGGVPGEREVWLHLPVFRMMHVLDSRSYQWAKFGIWTSWVYLYISWWEWITEYWFLSERLRIDMLMILNFSLRMCLCWVQVRQTLLEEVCTDICSGEHGIHNFGWIFIFSQRIGLCTE